MLQKMKMMQNKFPYVAGLEYDWYNDIFKNADDDTCERICNRKYGSILSDVDTSSPSYNLEYIAFLEDIKTTMKYAYKLVTDEFNPYDNKFQERTEKTIHGATETTNDYDDNVTTNDAYTDEFENGQRTDTSNDFQVPQNTTNERKVSKNESVTGTQTITNDYGERKTTIDAHTDKVSTKEYTDIIEIKDHGNVGVTENSELFLSTKSIIGMMKLYDMFIDEYIKYFCLGLWG